MHPDDAFAAGVSDGEIVEISSATGVLRIELRVTDSTARGSVSIPHGWEDVNVNRLMSHDDLDELTGMPRLSGTAVTVAPIHASTL